MKKHLFYVIICLISVTACAPRRDLVYFSNLAKVSSDKVNHQDLKIQPNDLLNIAINSQSTESNVLFASSGRNINPENPERKEGFRVSKEGLVNIPVIGNVKLEGLSVEQAQQTISKQLEKYVKNPVVDVQIVNFKITVIGEVNRPSTFTITGERINLLEALGMAGDMTVYGKRGNVLIVREDGGQRTMARLNLNDQDVFNSPFFNLKQNDIVYVEPDKSKAIEYSSNTRLLPVGIASISAIAVLLTAILRK